MFWMILVDFLLVLEVYLHVLKKCVISQSLKRFLLLGRCQEDVEQRMNWKFSIINLYCL